MKVRFWGVRGSIATPGPRTVRYGGNTSCVEVIQDGRGLILDAGSGICELGRKLVAGGPRDLSILITHTHMDHVQGFPFFVPTFVRGFLIEVIGPRDFEKGIEDVFRSQLMDYTVFPVRMEELAATIVFRDAEESFDLGPFRVQAAATNHPILTLAYRIEAQGESVVYAPDHEPYRDILSVPGETREIQSTVAEQNRRILEFVRGADLLIIDSQYTPEEYTKRLGWGHSTWAHSVDLAMEAGVRHLILFHHEPTRDDDALEKVLEDARTRVSEKGGDLEVSLAREGWVLSARGR